MTSQHGVYCKECGSELAIRVDFESAEQIKDSHKSVRLRNNEEHFPYVFKMVKGETYDLEKLYGDDEK